MENETTNISYKLVAMMMNDWEHFILIIRERCQLMYDVNDLLVMDELNMMLNLIKSYKYFFNKKGIMIKEEERLKFIKNRQESNLFCDEMRKIDNGII